MELPIKNSKWLIFGLMLHGVIASAQSGFNDRIRLNGYMDMVLLSGNTQPIGEFIYLNTYRVDLMPQFDITPKLNVTMLLEGADLFRLDEPTEGDKPGIIEWAYITYSHNDLLNIRLGTFAIPFGIYNELFYATPTHLTSFLPLLYSKQQYGSGNAEFSAFLFPRSASGLMIFGKAVFSEKYLLSYYTYYTNENPGSSGIGLGKYIGGRLGFESVSSELWKVGASYNAYLQSDDFVNKTLGLDVQFTLHNLGLYAELVMPQIGVRDTLQIPVPGQFNKSTSSYAQISYILWDKVTPYFRYDFFNTSSSVENDEHRVLTGGLSVAFHPQVILKAEAYISRYQDPGKRDSDYFISTLAIAF